LVQNIPDIAEIEINPVIITHQGTWALDAKVVLSQVPVPANPFMTATTLSHTLLTPKFHHFVFKPANPLVYQPGQYISVKVSDQKINAYSIVTGNSPDQFELLVDTSPGGVGSNFFENLKAGQTISYIGPFGIFTLKPDDGATHLLFLGTGSGCSPLRALIESALKTQKLTIPLTFYVGLRYQEDIFWQEYFQKLSTDYPNFTYKLCLSQPPPDWSGNIGHLTDFLKKDFPDASGCSAYLCGNNPMMVEAKKILLELGCPPKRIYQEQFT
jgi:ferredoxin-NADP reductase